MCHQELLRLSVCVSASAVVLKMGSSSERGVFAEAESAAPTSGKSIRKLELEK